METFFIILISILSLCTLVASFIFTRALFPVRVDKVRAALEANWKRSFWLGLMNTILITVLVMGLASLANSSPILYVPAFAIYGVLLIGLLVGFSAFNLILGERLFPDIHPVNRDVKAGAVLMLTCLLPFVGWFLLFPYVISLSVGAVVITIFQDRKKRESKAKD